jgi:serine protease Do
MRHFLRLDLGLGSLTAVACLSAFTAIAPPAARTQAPMTVEILHGPHLLLEHASDPGYLGVEIVDVDADKAQSLKLKDVHGAVITLVDHDAPAGQIGLKVNDVVLGLNGQPVANVDDLRRLIKVIPPGRKVSIEISRDGNIQTLAVALADRKAMEQAIWGKIGNGGDAAGSTPKMSLLGGGGDSSVPDGFHMPFFGGSLKVGALVEPLTSQMAEYLGVKNGLMVKQVEHKSEAETAGLHAFDVILKVGSDTIATSADWDRALRANAGKPVQVTILRDKKQQMVTLQVDSKRHQSAVEDEDIFGDGAASLMAELDEELAPELAAARTELGEMKLSLSEEQGEKLTNSIKDFKIDSQTMDQVRKMMDQLKQQMQEWTARESGCTV